MAFYRRVTRSSVRNLLAIDTINIGNSEEGNGVSVSSIRPVRGTRGTYGRDIGHQMPELVGEERDSGKSQLIDPRHQRSARISRSVALNSASTAGVEIKELTVPTMVSSPTPSRKPRILKRKVEAVEDAPAPIPDLLIEFALTAAPTTSPQKRKRGPQGTNLANSSEHHYSENEKPQSIGRPIVWCDTRQELCESLPSFRSYQGGSYAFKNLCRGYLIDGHASERDYMDSSIIISHAGGNSEQVDGERYLVKDQTWERGVIANLRSNAELQIPIVVIIGEKCPTAPAKLEHRYSVMDWFKVTHCWPEKDSRSGRIRCKFRFEKLDSSEKGWWSAETTLGVSADIAIEYISCQACKQESPWIYENEPMCLNKDCTMFWTIYNGRDKSTPKEFIYRKSFLHGKTIWPDETTKPPSLLAPSLPIHDEIVENDGRDVKRKFWKGMCCQKCGKLNCRELWKSWKCTNCDWEFTPKRSHFISADLCDPHRPEFTGPPIPDNVVDPSIRTKSTVLSDGRRAMTYELYKCGKVVHILANKSWNEMPGGPDWLLDKYQDPNMPFKRHELKTHKLSGRLLTQQFSFNSGVSYKYIVEVNSLPFEESPEVVQKALKIIQSDVTRIIPNALPMNEVLNVAYFQEQKMDFHDDGEEDLGPCVSSISLGSPAIMYFRVKSKYLKGDVSAADKAILQSNKNSVEGKGKQAGQRNILQLRIHHGDVIIMDGRAIQKYLEHAVTPEGYRIAVTARNISKQNVAINTTEKPTRILRKPTAMIVEETNIQERSASEGKEDTKEDQTMVVTDTVSQIKTLSHSTEPALESDVDPSAVYGQDTVTNTENIAESSTIPVEDNSRNCIIRNPAFVYPIPFTETYHSIGFNAPPQLPQTYNPCVIPTYDSFTTFIPTYEPTGWMNNKPDQQILGPHVVQEALNTNGVRPFIKNNNNFGGTSARGGPMYEGWPL